MELDFTTDDLERAESFLAAGDLAAAAPLLQEMRDSAAAWASDVCADTSDEQWFSFDNPFERLAYRRVEKDPRVLHQLDVPLARLYSDSAFVALQAQDFASARDLLMQAVRWNPMNCNYRLDLAEICRVLGDTHEWAALSFSVLERASDARVVGRAYSNLGEHLLDEHCEMAAAAAARLSERFAPGTKRALRLTARLIAEAPDAASSDDEQVISALQAEGVPAEPSAEMAVCLLMCASDAAQAGDAAAASDFTARAHSLVGAQNAAVLLKLIHESDAELAAETQGDE